MIKCTLCNAQLVNAAGLQPQEAGWSQIALNLPKANRYLSACPEHTPAEIASWVKSSLAVKR